MLGKIPVHLNIDSPDLPRDEVVSRFRNSRLFTPKQLCKNYFSVLVSCILDGGDPNSVIDENVPEIEGQLLVEITVVAELPADSAEGVLFVYTAGMSAELFEDECERTRATLVREAEKRCEKERKQLGFIGSLVSSLSGSLEAAHLSFIKSDYKGALAAYSGVSKRYPELARRMCEICRLILGQEPVVDPLALDVFILNHMYTSLYKMIGILPFDAKLAVQYYLIDKEIPAKRKMILLNQCRENFRIAGNSERAEDCAAKLTGMVDEIIAADTSSDSSRGVLFWREFLTILQDECNCT